MASLNDDPGARVAAISGLRGAYEPGDFGAYQSYSDFSPGYGLIDSRSVTPESLGRILTPTNAWDIDPNAAVTGNIGAIMQNQNKHGYFAGMRDDTEFGGAELYKTLTGFDTKDIDAYADYLNSVGLGGGLNRILTQSLSDPMKRELLWQDSSGKTLSRHKFSLEDSWFEKIAPTIIKGIVAAGAGAAAGAAAGAGGASGLGGSIAGGATTGYLGSAFNGQNPLQGLFAGGITGGLSSGLENYLGESEYLKGLRPGQIKQLAKFGTNTASNLVRGGKFDGMFLASQAPGLASIFDKGPTDMNEFDTPGGMSIPGGGTQIPSWAQPSGYEVPVYGPQSTSQPYLESMGGLNDLYNFGGSGFASTDGGLGEYTPADYTLSIPQSQSSGPFSGTSDVTAGPSQDPEWQKFLTSPQGRLIMQIMGRANPTLGAVGGMAASVLGGGNGQRMGPWQAGAGALASLYGYNRANSALKQQQKSLQSLFSPNSAYAKQMEQTLARKDAAAGRRSQYGPREVELQARLAELNSRNAPQIAQLSAARDSNRQRMMMDMLGLGLQSGAIGKLGSSLEDLYSSF